MSTRTTALHVPELVEHAAHDVAHAAAAVGLVDAVLSPLTPSIADLDLELTEDDVL
jgi:hypothetical protein